jgi:hypothetical protein
MTASEICQFIGEPQENVKFVSSYLVRAVKDGQVQEAAKRRCNVTGKFTKTYHDAIFWGAYNGQQQQKQAKASSSSQASSDAAERRRKLIEEQMKRRQQAAQAQSAADELSMAKAEFSNLTGYQGLEYEQAKKAYRQAARKYHPDLGGDGQEFLKLSESWRVIQNHLSKQ